MSCTASHLHRLLFCECSHWTFSSICTTRLFSFPPPASAQCLFHLLLPPGGQHMCVLPVWLPFHMATKINKRALLEGWDTDGWEEQDEGRPQNLLMEGRRDMLFWSWLQDTLKTELYSPHWIHLTRLPYLRIWKTTSKAEKWLSGVAMDGVVMDGVISH